MTNENIAEWRRLEQRKQRHTGDIARVLDRAEAEHRGLSAAEQTRIEELRDDVSRIEDDLDAAERRAKPGDT
ncbi:MAG: hypothetical protein M3N46_02635, partial [Actinomycetota bacterium]|nr:hypothetical protein [Actinomycetota bacterium]